MSRPRADDRYSPAVIRRLAAVSLLLVSGCASTEAPASAPASPTAPADRHTASACVLVARATAEHDFQFGTGTRAASRAVNATDPGVREAGRHLLAAGLEVDRLFVENDPDVDRGPANERLAEAQQGLLSACTGLFGPQPWPFDRQPSPAATG